MRLDVLLIISNKIKHIPQILLSLFLSAGFIFLLFLLLLYFNPNVFFNINGTLLKYFILTLVVQTLMQLFNALAIMLKKYRIQSINTITIVILTSIFYFVSHKVDILILFQGIFWASLIIVFVNIFLFRKIFYFFFKFYFFRKKNDKVITGKIYNFIFISSPMTFLNSNIQQFPIFFLSNFSNQMVIYYFFIFNKFILSPMSLIFSPLSQILTKEFSLINFNILKCKIKLALKNLLKALPVILVIFFIWILFLNNFLKIKSLNTFIIISSILLPVYIYINFVSIISNIIPITGKVQYEVYWKLPASIFLSLILIPNFNNLDIYSVYIIISVVMFLIYLFYHFLIIKLINNYNKQ